MFSSNEHIQAVWVTNSRPCPATLCIEPWGDEMAVPPGASFLVSFHGPTENFPAVAWDDLRITVSGWSGSTFSVHQDGDEIRSSGANTVPEMPKTLD
jgi:hypothetical protein